MAKSPKSRQKTLLQRMARKRLKPRCASLNALFTAAAEQLGKTWVGGKADGYRLLRELVGSAPIVVKQPRIVRSTSEREAYNAKMGRTTSIDPLSDDFLLSYEWRRLRMVVLKKRGARCDCCGFTAKDGIKIHVDHIKPRRHHPELALSEDNLQILCEVCNHGKGNWDETDWRERQVPPEHYEPFWSKRVN